MNKNKINNIYTRIVTIFLVLTILIIFIILHFALAKVTIKINSNIENKELNGIIKVESENNKNISKDSILGKIIKVENELLISIPSSQKITKSTKAGGYVTIYNNYSKDQILIATTRLLTPDNKLFRITENITVPRGSNTIVWAEADEEGEAYIVGPTNFIIPGLWIGLQDKIYAKSIEGMGLENIPSYLITQEDIDEAQKEMEKKAIIQAIGDINNLLNKNLWINEKNIILEFETIESTPLNAESKEMILKQKITAHGLIFSQYDLINKTKTKFIKELDVNKSLKEFNDNSFTYNILEIYPEKNEALIEVFINATINSNENIWNINKDELIGLKKIEIKQYLKQYNINDTKINFFPFWVNKVPKLKDHIIIE